MRSVSTTPRWPLCAGEFASVSENYPALCATWEVAKDAVKDPEMRGQTGGIGAQMEKFNLLFYFEQRQKVINMDQSFRNRRPIS